MEQDSGSRPPTLLERLDVALAHRLATRTAEDTSIDGIVQVAAWRVTDEERICWLVGALGLRGFRVRTEDVQRILLGESERYLPQHQEHKLVSGLAAAFDELIGRAVTGELPDGWKLVESFRRTTEHVDRFRNNVLRRDRPWDALVHLEYPDPDALDDLLDRFHPRERYGETVENWEGLHPVRRGFRVLWRFARLAPFPDFNQIFAFAAASAFLVANGYPLPIPLRADRALLDRVVRGRPPDRLVQLEARLLESLDATRSARSQTRDRR